MPEFLNLAAKLLNLQAQDLRGVFLAWARVLPTLTLVPAFGLKALPASTRVGLGIAIAIAIAPALRPIQELDTPLIAEWGRQFALGTPIALEASALIWAALMAGSAVDALRGAQEQANLPVFEDSTSPLGALLALLTALVFLESGGATRIAKRLVTLDQNFSKILVMRVAHQLVAAIEIALAVAAPIIAVAIIVEVAGALIARAASPASVNSLISPLRSVAVLGVTALLLDRMAELLALFAYRIPQ